MRASFRLRRGLPRHLFSAIVAATLVVGSTNVLIAGSSSGPSRSDSAATAARVDALIEASLAKEKVELAAGISDEQFLRRASFDITGAPPSVDDLTRFVLDPDPAKRSARVDKLIESDGFARRWARYWRDAIAYRTQDRRFQIVRQSLEDWLAEQFAAGRGWDEIVTELITATGDVRENGQTGLIMAQMGEANEIAAEVSRLFLGIQIQCAQCHDHPYDKWKREDFHKLAAFFPRVRVQPKRDENGRQRGFEVVSTNVPARAFQNGGMTSSRYSAFRASFVKRFDRDRDGKLARSEVPRQQQRFFDRLVRSADKDGDKLLTTKELEQMRSPPQARRVPRGEHFMSDLEKPEQRGELIHPAFFVNEQTPGEFVDDVERRRALAGYLRAEDNVWFARSMANRVWKEMIGRGFVEPVDDMGPERDAAHPEALDVLAKGFRESGFRVDWLVRTVAATRAYQRQSQEPSPLPDALPFAAVEASRLPADSIFEAVVRSLDLGSRDLGGGSRRSRGGRYSRSTPRSAFEQIFGFDPSTPSEEIAGTVPQALFLMNSPVVARAVRAQGDTMLSRLLEENDHDRSIVDELYLRTLSREATDREQALFGEYRGVAPSRDEAFEDLLWSLVNSTEFQTKR
jgi:hypothetical protein